MAVKNDRIRVYLLSDVGTDGAVDMQYVRQPSTDTDEGYWAAVSAVSSHAKIIGAQEEHVALYAVTVDTHVPLHNTSDAVLSVLGSDNEEVQFLKVDAVMLLRNTGEKQARCLDVSDAAYTLTT